MEDETIYTKRQEAMKRRYMKPCIEAHKVCDGITLLQASLYKTVIRFGIEGDIEEQEFNETEFTTTWGDSDGSNSE